MSDPCGELREALEPWLRGWAGIVAAFGSKRVKVYKTLPPPDATAPYLFIAGLTVLDDSAECMDNAEVEVQLDVWSLTDPPGFTEAEALAAAARDALVATEDTGDSPAFTLTNFRVVSAQHASTTYLTDPSDGKTVHAVILARLYVDRV